MINFDILADNDAKPEEIFLKSIVSCLGICLTTPEEDIIKQDEVGEEIYFIMQGDCTVNLLDFRGNNHQALRLLVEGDHFGEVSFLFKCPITCTVVSRNYNTMARLTHLRLRNLIADYPIY